MGLSSRGDNIQTVAGIRPTWTGGHRESNGDGRVGETICGPPASNHTPAVDLKELQNPLHKSKGGLTLKEHGEIFERMDELLYTDPDELLPQHQHLLLVLDKTKLTRGSLSDRQTWITRMEAAMSAKERLCREVMDLEGTEDQGVGEVDESSGARQDNQQE